MPSVYLLLFFLFYALLIEQPKAAGEENSEIVPYRERTSIGMCHFVASCYLTKLNICQSC